MMSDFRQYIAGYTVANFWRHPIRHHVIFTCALELLTFFRILSPQTFLKIMLPNQMFLLLFILLEFDEKAPKQPSSNKRCVSSATCSKYRCTAPTTYINGPCQANLVLIASAQSRQNLRCSLIQAVNQEEPLDRKPDPWPLWMTGHAQLKFVMTECSKTQFPKLNLRFDRRYAISCKWGTGTSHLSRFMRMTQTSLLSYSD